MYWTVGYSSFKLSPHVSFLKCQEYKTNILLLRAGHFTAITQGSIVQTMFHGVLMAIFPKEFHDPMNATSTELSKVQQGP